MTSELVDWFVSEPIVVVNFEMSIATLFLTSTLLFGNGINLPLDTLKIEQKAFDYFVSNVDSIYLIGDSKPQPFDSSSDTIYFSGTSSGKGVIQLAMARVFDNGFLVIDTVEDLTGRHPRITSLTDIQEPLVFSAPYVVKREYNWFQENKKDGEIFINVSNRLFHRGFYYVKIVVYTRVLWVHNEMYLKFNSVGQIIDVNYSHGIE